MFRNRSIVFHLAALALAAAVPFLVLTAYNIYDRSQTESARATGAVLRIAESTAQDTDRFLSQVRRLLGLLAERPQIRALDPRRCDPLLAEFRNAFPLAANLVTMDASGNSVCSAIPQMAAKWVDPAIFQARVMRTPELSVGEPMIGPFTGKWVVPLGMRVLNAEGRVAGVIVLAVDLVGFGNARTTKGAPPYAITAIIDAHGTIVSRSEEMVKWVGKPAPEFEAGHVFAGEQGTGRSRGGDGDEWIYAFARIPGSDWYALTVRPTEQVFVSSMRIGRVSGILVLVIATLVAALCLLLSRRITIPIHAIAAKTREAGAGNLDICIEPEGPREITEFAIEFNRMFTSRRYAETALRESEQRQRTALERFETIFLHAPEAALITDFASGQLLDVNEAYCRLLGRPREELIGRTSIELGQWSEQQHDAMLETVRTQGRVRRNELRIRRPTGELRSVVYSVDPMKLGDQACLLTLFRDVTERRQAEDAQREYTAHLKKLLQRVMAFEEQERRRLGRELHDRTGSNLSALLLGLGLMRAKLSPENAAKLGPRISDFENLLRETMEQVEDVLAHLRPPALDELGLLAALGHFGRLIADRTDLQFEIAGSEPVPRLAREVELSLFRIAQEALNNATKHAQASRLEISLHANGDQVVLIVADNGRGFDAARHPVGGSGLGMMTMRERAQGAGATLVVDAMPGEGTRIIVTVQLPAMPASMRENGEASLSNVADTL